MPDTDLSPAVPPDATWAKIRYTMETVDPAAELTAKLWSGPLDDAVTIKGPTGEVLKSRSETNGFGHTPIIEPLPSRVQMLIL
jgi:hypothetical protein